MNYQPILLKQLLFLVLFTTCSFFNNEITASNGKILDVQDDARFSGCGQHNCEINFSFQINMAEPYLPGSTNFDELVPMYLAYDIGTETSGIIPINFADFEDLGQVIAERTILEWKYELTIPEGTAVPEVYSITLLTEHPSLPGVHIPYPVKDYAKGHSFFPCHIFDHSFGTMTPPPVCNLDPLFPPRVSNELIFNCANCNFPLEIPIDPNGAEPFEPGNPLDNEGGDLPFHSNEENLTALQFQPNPFNSQLHLPFELKETAAFEFQVFDATGKILHQEANQQGAGAHQIELDTDTWPTGVYYAQVKTGNFTKSYRLVKIE